MYRMCTRASAAGRAAFSSILAGEGGCSTVIRRSRSASINGRASRVRESVGAPSVDTTMVCADQDALDLIRAFERENLDVAREA
jgi:hypothetical protein